MTTSPSRRRVAVAPDTLPEMHAVFCEAVARNGATVVPVAEAEALVWADPARGDLFPSVIEETTQPLQWIQLPYAGVEPFVPYLFEGPTWTCGKGVYAPPVAEHALGLMLAGRRDLHRFVGASSWGDRTGENLLGASITILGGGGIAESFIELIAPFGCDVSVVRRSAAPVPGANRTVTMARAMELFPRTDVLLIAWALTDETAGFVDRSVLDALPDHAWVINVGRGGHIVTDDLVDAFERGTIGGAGLDVTDPEPLPDGHRLWDFRNCIITPHVGNTAEMGLPLISARVADNTRRFCDGDELVGTIDLDAGY